MRTSTPFPQSALFAAAPVAGFALWIGGDAWRLGGGVWALGLLVGLAGIVGPVVLAEAAIGRTIGLPLPKALGRLAGPAGALTGWVGVSAAALLSVLLVTFAAWGIGLALFDSGAARGGVAGLFGMLVWVLAAKGRSARSAHVLAVGVRAHIALSILGLVSALVIWPDAVFSLADPRLPALGHGLAGALSSSLLFAPVGLGFVALGAARIQDRARSARLIAQTVSLVGAVGLGLALTGFTALYLGGQAPEAGGDLALQVLASLDAGRASLPPWMRLWLAATMGLGALLFATSTADMLADAVAPAGDRRLDALGAVLALVTVTFTLLGLGDPTGAGATLVGLMVRWLCLLGLPVIALLVSCEVGWARETPELLRKLDREGGLRLGAWLPGLLRWVSPTLLLVALAGNTLTSSPLILERGGGSALGSLVHALAPALVLLWIGVSSTAALWLSDSSPRET